MSLQHFIIQTAPECAPIEARELEYALAKIRPDTEIGCSPATGTYDGLRHTIADLTLERDALRREVDALVGQNDKEGNCPPGEWECLEDAEGKFVDNCCHRCWAAWAKQAAQAWKDVANG